MTLNTKERPISHKLYIRQSVHFSFIFNNIEYLPTLIRKVLITKQLVWSSCRLDESCWMRLVSVIYILVAPRTTLVVKMKPIATYIFLDLETTGLPRVELFKTKITELSMVAVKRDHMEQTVAGALPRVLNKLTMCFNPGRPIDPGATKTSGLDNFLLEGETSFNMTSFNCINSFIESQHKPVCLIAQNGIDFDFPILKKRFEVLSVSLADDIMCADSLYGFFDILNMGPTQQNVNNNHTNPECSTIAKALCDAEIDKTMLKDDAEESETKKADDSLKTPSTMQRENETTPKSSNQEIKTVKRLNQVKRRLFYAGYEKPPQGHYKLAAIYERVLGRPAVDAHRAENDCMMTAEIATAKAQQFIQWIDEHHFAFNEIKAIGL